MFTFQRITTIILTEFEVRVNYLYHEFINHIYVIALSQYYNNSIIINNNNTIQAKFLNLTLRTGFRGIHISGGPSVGLEDEF